MKSIYEEPKLDLLILPYEDILFASDEDMNDTDDTNDGPGTAIELPKLDL